MATSEDVLRLLQSIDASLKQLVSLLRGPVAGGRSQPARTIASDKDLDSQYGDPDVRMKDPRDWSGPSMKGRKFSDCPPEYLDLIADRFEYFADQADEKHEKLENGKPASTYKRLDAARARGWAARIRSGRHTQRTDASPTRAAGWSDAKGAWATGEPAADIAEPPDDSDIPF